MAYFYSPMTEGFYTTEVHGGNMPDDVVQLTDQEHAALIDGQSAGMEIKAASNGKPVLKKRKPLPPQPAPDLKAAIQALINGDAVAAQNAINKSR